MPRDILIFVNMNGIPLRFICRFSKSKLSIAGYAEREGWISLSVAKKRDAHSRVP